MLDDELGLIPARKSRATLLSAGGRVQVINTYGTQIVDTWAFNRSDINEFMSMEHSRTHMEKLTPMVGDCLVSNRRRPILSLVEDTCPGHHDTTLAACDIYRYQLLGCTGYHDNCTDNLAEAMKDFGYSVPCTPSPLNLWENIPVTADKALHFEPPASKPGDYVVLRAEQEIILVFSACPQDVVPLNGPDCTPRDAHYRILEGGL